MTPANFVDFSAVWLTVLSAFADPRLYAGLLGEEVVVHDVEFLVTRERILLGFADATDEELPLATVRRQTIAVTDAGPVADQLQKKPPSDIEALISFYWVNVSF